MAWPTPFSSGCQNPKFGMIPQPISSAHAGTVPSTFALHLFACSVLLFNHGCAPPASRFKEMRLENIELQQRVRQLSETAESQQRQIELQEQVIRTIGELGPRRINELYHVDHIKIGRYSAGYDENGEIGDEGIRVYVELFDQDGHAFKAAGEVRILIYEFTQLNEPILLSTCHYDVEQAKAHWLGRLLSYYYKFKCPWQTPPTASEVVVRVLFIDYLTGSTLTASKTIPVVPPISSQTKD